MPIRNHEKRQAFLLIEREIEGIEAAAKPSAAPGEQRLAAVKVDIWGLIPRLARIGEAIKEAFKDGKIDGQELEHLGRMALRLFQVIDFGDAATPGAVVTEQPLGRTPTQRAANERDERSRAVVEPAEHSGVKDPSGRRKG